jgi:hypothetical protein
VVSNQFADRTVNLYDWGWNQLPIQFSCSNGPLDPKPKHLSKMIDIAKILSADFPFIRVDLYSASRIYFGELTLIPNAGIGTYLPDSWDIKLGEELSLFGTIKKPSFSEYGE